jgi:hypothetical protein
MNQETSQSDSKKAYEPPQLTTISLRPEEAVLGHCKIAGGGGGMFGICNAAPACVNVGS